MSAELTNSKDSSGIVAKTLGARPSSNPDHVLAAYSWTSYLNPSSKQEGDSSVGMSVQMK